MEEIHPHKYKWYEFGCKDASYLNTKAAFSKLSFSEKFLYTFHLAICKYCRRFVKQVAEIEQLLKAKSTKNVVELRLEKKQAINQLITENLSKK
jgi:hypothetical protein